MQHRFHFYNSSIKFFVFLLAITLSFLSPKKTFAQNTPPTQDDFQKQQQILEDNTERDENQKFDYENLVDLISILQKHPVNLNKASREDFLPLVDLKVLNDQQVNAILNYRDQLGKFISIFELQAVPYLDVATIKNMLPYVTVNSTLATTQIKPIELLTGGDYMLLMRGTQIIEEQKGFSPADSNSTSRYLGSPLNLYTRFRYSYGTKFSYGITGQKDAGEEFFKGTQKQGFDFYSAHIFYRGNGLVKAVALGDYTLNFGQGLLMGSGFGVNKSSYITSIKNGGREIRPYTSADEFNFFRGSAITLGSNHISATGFASYKKIDGNVSSIDTIDENTFVTSIGGNGYHRTTTEVENKNTNDQTVFGANLDYNTRGFSAGATFLHSQFTIPVSPAYQPYNIYYFQGDQLTNYGAHFDWQYKNFNWFGEAAYSNPGSFGMLSGLLVSVDPKVDLVFIYRNYARDFQSLYSNAFGESSTSINEKGLYSGLIIRPARAWELDAYADFFSKPWLAYLVDAPSVGVDYLVQLNYRPNKVLAMYMRWKDETKQANSSLNDTPLDYVANTEKQNLRFDLSYKAT
ncbi:MAG: helix-hairpin-helix domain-containing protein, partial [Chitinophagales bacterium]|nr:helix-hairpin-helix domain-containing protein [Chitinophagales bacterium]